jgi:hypothetical protein
VTQDPKHVLVPGNQEIPAKNTALQKLVEHSFSFGGNGLLALKSHIRMLGLQHVLQAAHHNRQFCMRRIRIHALYMR